MTTLFPEMMTLVRSGLYDRMPSPEELERIASLELGQWKEIVTMVREQTVSGIVSHAVTRISETVRVPDSILFNLMADAERIAVRSRRIIRTAEKIDEVLSAQGFHPVVMKGPAVAAWYPKPELRVSGDIDLYFQPEEMEPVRAWIENAGLPTKKAPDGSFHFDTEGTDVDVHGTYFDLHCDASLLPVVPSPEATLLMLSAHILKHACGTGVGLRQLCDMAIAYHALDGQYEPDALKALYQRTKTLKWNQLLSAFLNTWMEARVPDFAPEHPVSPAPLEKIVLEGGNFGHFAAQRQKAMTGSEGRRKADTLLRMLRRLPFSMKYAPGETISRLRALTNGNMRRR